MAERRVLRLAAWRHTEDLPIKQGFTPGDGETMPTLRVGPLVVAAEVDHEEVGA